MPIHSKNSKEGRKEGYCQAELDNLFSCILVLPKLMYGISVYGSSPPDHTKFP